MLRAPPSGHFNKGAEPSSLYYDGVAPTSYTVSSDKLPVLPLPENNICLYKICSPVLLPLTTTITWHTSKNLD